MWKLRSIQYIQSVQLGEPYSSSNNALLTYQQSYYHPFCLINFNSNNMTQIQNCWEGDNTVSLPDLATENANVRSMWQSWITQLVANYTIDGLRMDSCFELDYGFFEPFQASGSSNSAQVRTL